MTSAKQLEKELSGTCRWENIWAQDCKGLSTRITPLQSAKDSLVIAKSDGTIMFTMYSQPLTTFLEFLGIFLKVGDCFLIIDRTFSPALLE